MFAFPKLVYSIFRAHDCNHWVKVYAHVHPDAVDRWIEQNSGVDKVVAYLEAGVAYYRDMPFGGAMVNKFRRVSIDDVIIVCAHNVELDNASVTK